MSGWAVTTAGAESAAGAGKQTSSRIVAHTVAAGLAAALGSHPLLSQVLCV